MNKYKIIYCDPPWQYKNQKTRAATNNHYPTLSIQDLKSLNIRSIASDNSVLAMWYTSAFAREAMELASAWGFTIKTMKLFTWVKLNKNYIKNITKNMKKHGCMNSSDVLYLINDQLRLGLGNYTHANSEDYLLAVRGKGVKRVNNSINQVILAPIGKHSEKPLEAREKLELLYGNIPRIELFAQQNVDGWHAWGNECNSNIQL